MRFPQAYFILILGALVSNAATGPSEYGVHFTANNLFARPRFTRSLTGVFPFNPNPDHAHFHHEDPVNQKLGRQDPSASNDVSIASLKDEKCVEKVMMIEETVYDDGIECHHSYDKRCHTTYTTDYIPQQVEECGENYVKECFIEYKQVAKDEKVQICVDTQARNCDSEGPTVCETVYESECETTHHVHEVDDDSPVCRVMLVEKCQDQTIGYETKQKCDKWPKQVCELKKEIVKKYNPETKCRKKPRQVCGPGPCPLVAGPKDCRDDVKTVVQEVPEESCSLRAQPYCNHVTKILPELKPTENCVDVPKEVCVRVRNNPRQIKRPVIKKWCYTPTEESGIPTTTTTTTTTTSPPETSSENLPQEQTTSTEGTTTSTEIPTTTSTETPTTTIPTESSSVTSPSLFYDAPVAARTQPDPDEYDLSPPPIN